MAETVSSSASRNLPPDRHSERDLPPQLDGAPSWVSLNPVSAEQAMAMTTKKSTATRRAVTPQKAMPKPKLKLKRKANPRTRPAVDIVRASRDGHEFHEAWVARKCLQAFMDWAQALLLRQLGAQLEVR